MKAIVIFALLAFAGVAIANPVDEPNRNVDGVKRDKRQFGFGGSASGAESHSIGLNTPLGSIGLSESKAFAKENNFGAGGGLGGGVPVLVNGGVVPVVGLGGGVPVLVNGGGVQGSGIGGGFAHAHGFNTGISGPLGGIGIGASHVGGFSGGIGAFGRK